MQDLMSLVSRKYTLTTQQQKANNPTFYYFSLPLEREEGGVRVGEERENNGVREKHQLVAFS